MLDRPSVDQRQRGQAAAKPEGGASGDAGRAGQRPGAPAPDDAAGRHNGLCCHNRRSNCASRGREQCQVWAAGVQRQLARECSGGWQTLNSLPGMPSPARD